MVSKINNKINYNPTFTSVIPVRVFVDGVETFNNKNIKSACHQLTNILAGPANNEKKVNIIKEFAKYDPDYIIEYGYRGYPKKQNSKVMHPSDYFKCITQNDKNYLFTGVQAEQLSTLGKEVGKEQKFCKQKNILNSFELRVAKSKYFNAILKFIKSVKLRIRERFEQPTKIKSGKTIELIINMDSNKKYGLSTFKMKLNEIKFQPHNS